MEPVAQTSAIPPNPRRFVGAELGNPNAEPNVDDWKSAGFKLAKLLASVVSE